MKSIVDDFIAEYCKEAGIDWPEQSLDADQKDRLHTDLVSTFHDLVGEELGPYSSPFPPILSPHCSRRARSGDPKSGVNPWPQLFSQDSYTQLVANGEWDHVLDSREEGIDVDVRTANGTLRSLLSFDPYIPYLADGYHHAADGSGSYATVDLRKIVPLTTRNPDDSLIRRKPRVSTR